MPAHCGSRGRGDEAAARSPPQPAGTPCPSRAAGRSALRPGTARGLTPQQLEVFSGGRDRPPASPPNSCVDTYSPVGRETTAGPSRGDSGPGPRKRALTRHRARRRLDLGPPSSRTGTNKFPLFISHPVWGVLSPRPKGTETEASPFRGTESENSREQRLRHRPGLRRRLSAPAASRGGPPASHRPSLGLFPRFATGLTRPTFQNRCDPESHSLTSQKALDHDGS